jgi:serine/threonine protein kinase
MIGTQILNFQILEKLGEGGMGVVYKGLDTGLDRLVAIKVLSSEYAGNPEIVDRFRSEAKAQATMNHTNIATLFAFLQVEGRCLIVMEYMEGETVEQLILRRGLIPPADAVILFKQALLGIGFAHRAGIVHRDIKPSNMMVTHSGIVKVMDFGIAKNIIGGSQKKTRTGMTLGTAAYMSPEQILNRDVDFRSDIYSLGVTLYQILTARLPFEDPSDFQLMSDHVKTPPPPPTTYYPYIPKGIEQCVLKALAKDPAERFQTVERFGAALEHPDGLPPEFLYEKAQVTKQEEPQKELEKDTKKEEGIVKNDGKTRIEPRLASTQLASTRLASTQLASTRLASTQLAPTQLASTPLAPAQPWLAKNRKFVVIGASVVLLAAIGGGIAALRKPNPDPNHLIDPGKPLLGGTAGGGSTGGGGGSAGGGGTGGGGGTLGPPPGRSTPQQGPELPGGSIDTGGGSLKDLIPASPGPHSGGGSTPGGRSSPGPSGGGVSASVNPARQQLSGEEMYQRGLTAYNQQHYFDPLRDSALYWAILSRRANNEHGKELETKLSNIFRAQVNFYGQRDRKAALALVDRLLIYYPGNQELLNDKQKILQMK